MAENKEKDKTQQAIADAEAREAARIAANQEEEAALLATQQAELEGLQQHNAAQYSNLGQIVGDIQSKIDVAKTKDETSQKRENAYRYISGLGDTLSSLANLVGVANNASNQQQTYNSNAVVQKAEEARKARKIELDDLSNRLDEMRARERDLKAAGTLADAQLKAKQGREQLTLKQQQDALARETQWNLQQQAWKEEEAARAQENWQKTFDENARQFNAEQKRLKDQNDARLKAEKEMAEQKAAIELLKQQQKKTEDPKHQAQVLSSKIVGIRDELAGKMGYKDYNEYLRYKKVDGWGKDIDGQRNRESKRIRNQRSAENPETEEFLKMLQSPEELTEEQIRMLMGVSKVFSDAVGASTVTEEAPGAGAAAPTPKKEEPESDEQGREKVDY